MPENNSNLAPTTAALPYGLIGFDCARDMIQSYEDKQYRAINEAHNCEDDRFFTFDLHNIEKFIEYVKDALCINEENINDFALTFGMAAKEVNGQVRSTMVIIPVHKDENNEPCYEAGSPILNYASRRPWPPRNM